MCSRNELQPGAYVADTQTKELYEVEAQINNMVRLIDVRSPVDDPTRRSVAMSATNLKRFELVRHARSLEEFASVEEYGPLSMAG